MSDQINSYELNGVKFYTPNKRFAWMRPRDLGKKVRIKVKLPTL